MLHGSLVSTAESITVSIAISAGNRRMTIGIVVIGIGAAMMFNVVAGCFDAFVETAALDIALKILRRPIPVIVVLHCRKRGLSVRSGGIRLETLTHEP